MGGGNSQYGGQYGSPTTGNLGSPTGQFYNPNSSGQPPGQQGMNKAVPPPHHHLRNSTGQQNPQQVADNILQMASAYPSHHTVILSSVSLSKNYDEEIFSY